MNAKTEKIWQRDSIWFVVELKVGNTWVAHKKFENEGIAAARLEAQRMLRDPSVRAVRVCEHKIVHTNTAVWGDEAGPELRVPDKMKITNKKVECPVCHEPSVVADDGNTKWAFCAKCNRALPAA